MIVGTAFERISEYIICCSSGIRSSVMGEAQILHSSGESWEERRRIFKVRRERIRVNVAGVKDICCMKEERDEEEEMRGMLREEGC